MLGLAHGGAQAVLGADHADTVAAWNVGSKVSLLCGKASNVRLAVLLDGCMPKDTAIAKAEQAAQTQADLSLARQPLTVPASGGRDGDPAKVSLDMLLLGYMLGVAAKDCPVAVPHPAVWTIGCVMRRG
jgi:hypothetical protein